MISRSALWLAATVVPEGDTIHKIANYLAPKLASQRLIDVRMADKQAAARCRNQRIDAVFARGKHLFVTLDNDLALRSHLGMYGSWHRYGKNEAWKKPQWQASLVLETQHDDYVCFNAKEVELVRRPSVRDRVVQTRLGQDLIADDIDFDALLRRVRDVPAADAPLIDVLLDQRVAAGIGNVYKSELMFIERLSPKSLVAELPNKTIAQCFETAARLLRNNLGGGKRVTRNEGDNAGRLWVYRREAMPCLQCDTPINYARLGQHHRSTYWCPSCQADAS